jgi:hypothetical protein
MKQSPGDQNLEQRLRASKFSGEGFLGTDERPLDEIIADDQRLLDMHDIDKDALLQALRDAYRRARESLGAAIEIKPAVTARYYESRGKIPSPFRGDGVFEKGEAEITDASTGQSLHVTPLGLALIEKHGFFQGRGSRYRIEPDLAASMLL